MSRSETNTTLEVSRMTQSGNYTPFGYLVVAVYGQGDQDPAVNSTMPKIRRPRLVILV